MMKTKNGVTLKRGQILLHDMHAQTSYFVKYPAKCYLGFLYITTVVRQCSRYSLIFR